MPEKAMRKIFFFFQFQLEKMGNHCGFHSALALKKLDFDSVDITSTIIIVPFFRIMKSCLDFFVSHQIFDFLALTHPV